MTWRDWLDVAGLVAIWATYKDMHHRLVVLRKAMEAGRRSLEKNATDEAAQRYDVAVSLELALHRGFLSWLGS